MKELIDYEELIEEIKAEVSTGSLEKTDVIQVLRLEQSMSGEYNPIVDWYYDHETMMQELAPDKSDSEAEKQEKKLVKDQYEKDQATLETITVSACLDEMYDKSKPLKPKKRGKNTFFGG